MSTDAEHLIYPGMINALNGQPGGGKTWVALHTCAEAIKQGLHVMFIDLEGNPASIVGRLLALDCGRDVILEHFHYVRPGAAMSIDSWEIVEANIRRWDVALVVIDSIGELLALQGIRSSNDDDEVAKLKAAGLAVVDVDPKGAFSKNVGPSMLKGVPETRPARARRSSSRPR